VRRHLVPCAEVASVSPRVVALLILPPGLCARISFAGDHVERPHQLARDCVESANVFGRRVFSLSPGVAGAGGVARYHDNVSDDEWTCGIRESPGQRRVLEVQARATLVAETRRWLSGFGVHRVQIFAAHSEDPLVDVPGAAPPVVHTTRALSALVSFVKRLLPEHTSRLGIECHDEAGGILRIEDAVDHDRGGAQIRVASSALAALSPAAAGLGSWIAAAAWRGLPRRWTAPGNLQIFDIV